MHDSDSEGQPDSEMLNQSASNICDRIMGDPSISHEEQLRLLQQQLHEQQKILLDLQQRSGTSHVGHSAAARRAARRAAASKYREQVEELEGRLKGVSAVHCSLVAENGMLRRRMQLLEQGVQMREQHIEGLIKGRQQPQITESYTGNSAAHLGLDQSQEPCTRTSQQDASSSAGREQIPLSDTQRWTSFSQFPDPKSWCTQTCQSVRALTPYDYQRLWTEFVKEASMLALSAEAHNNSLGESLVQSRLLKVI